MDSRRDFTSKKVFSGYFSELGEKANSALKQILEIFPRNFFGGLFLTAIALLRALGNKPEVAARP